MKSDFFIDRPIFSTVISIVIVLLGLIGVTMLPVDQYPQIVPPVVKVSASYPGAGAETVSQAVATPIEQELNGTPGMLYMESSCTNTGSFSATITFDINTDADIAAVEIQNRVKEAESRLPAEVVKNGISVDKQATSKLMTITLKSHDPKFDEIYLSNYATLNILDMLKRVPGVGRVSNVGSRYYAMQIKVQPEKLAALGLTVQDLQNALKEQNRESAAGVLGQQPVSGVDVTIPITAKGRLSRADEFEDIVIKANPDGSILRLRDVATIALEASSYNTESGIDGENAAVMEIRMIPGMNAMEVSTNIKKAMESISKNFPEGISYDIPFDMTTYISQSIKEVYKTLFEALILVILVVFLSLQSWRATLIPAIAVPISLIGTFGVMLAAGFTLNTMTLLGLVLAIGTVVDDAIVVVENVDRIIRQDKLPPKEATKKAMKEIGGALIAMSLVLCAVFIPVSFLNGMSGILFRQFSITITVSVIISTIVALTLSPVMCAIFLKPESEDKPKNLVFRTINKWLDKGSVFYERMVGRSMKHPKRIFASFGVAIIMIWAMSRLVPQSFIPQEDQGYFTIELEMPEGTTLERTRKVTKRAMDYLLSQNDVAHVLDVNGSSPRVGTNQARAQLTVIMKPWEERQNRNLPSFMDKVSKELNTYPESRAYISSPPVIPGMGNSGGFEMVLESKGNMTYADLQNATDTLLYYAKQRKEFSRISSSMQEDIPQIYLDVDRDMAKLLGVSVSDIFTTMKAFTGSVYVNDFNLFNRVYKVYIQADAPYRMNKDNLNLYFVKGNAGKMIPITSIGKTNYTTGPGTIKRFNMYTSSTISGEAAQGYSSGQAMQILEEIAREKLPPEIGIEWSGLSFQEKQQSGQVGIVMLLAFLFVFLFLAAQYESWSIPIAVLLSLPIACVGAFLAIWIFGLENNVYFQIGLVMLIGLAAKNAILIVEFAKEQVEAGKDVVEAARTAAVMRFRPIVMTSLTFVLGMLPLVLASGPGSASRHSIGVGVFFGMLVAITIGIVFVPFFFVQVYKMKEKKRKIRPMISKTLIISTLVIFMGSCSTPRKCTAPELNLPEAIMPDRVVDSLCIADLKWTELISDTLLTKLIDKTLEQNKDMLIAADRVNELKELHRVAKSSWYPSIDARGYINHEMNQNSEGDKKIKVEPGIKASLSWEIDFFGKIRQANKGAMADYMSSIEAQRATQMTLIAAVSTAYFELIALDNELHIVQRTLKTREENVRHAKLRFEGGLTTEIPYQQAEVEYARTAAMIPELEKKIQIKENEISLLAGEYPTRIERSKITSRQSFPLMGQIGVASELVNRRPDLRGAEQELKSAAAKVGVAWANRFPSFRINLQGGLENNAIEKFFSSPWTYVLGEITSPIFHFNKYRAKYKASIQAYEQAKHKYEKKVLEAFKEVNDAVITYQTTCEKVELMGNLKEASGKYVDLTRYQLQTGSINYIDILDAQRSYFKAEIDYSNALRDEYLAILQLYKALGGGWK